MDFNVSPYYDDFDEDKKFLRVLFRPGYSLQARELTQAQTILQKQVERLGSYIFKNKSRVIPGQLFNTTCYSIKLEPTDVDNGVVLDTFIKAVDNVIVTGETTGVRASIIHTEQSTADGDATLLFISYLSNGFNGETQFAQNEILKFDIVAKETTVTNGDTTTTVLTPQTYTDPLTGDITTVASGSYRVRIQNTADYHNMATVSHITEGIFYVNGMFVKVDTQKIVTSKYNNLPTCNIGLDIIETVVTPEDDASLLDNSNGSPNYTAPGAHRFKMNLVLTSKDIGYGSDQFIRLSTLRKGVLEFAAKGTDLAEIEDLLARRTYDESGDYTVRPFELEMKEHRNSDQGVWVGTTAYQVGDVVFYQNPVTSVVQYYVCLDNGVSGTAAPTHSSGAASDGGVRWRYTRTPQYDYGVYSADEGGDATKIAFGIKNGKAYVKGYEFETQGVRYIEAPKARDYARITNSGIPIQLGALIDVVPFGTPDIDNFQIVDLFSVDTPPTTAQTLGTMTAAIDGSGTATPNNAATKLNYSIVHYQANATAPTEYFVAKTLASNVTTTTFPVALGTFQGSGGTAVTNSQYLTTSKIGTARIRYIEGGQTLNGRATAKISLMDVQMDPGKDFRKVRVIGTPLSLGSTSAGGDPNCFRALVLPTTYNSSNIGQSTVATTGTSNVDMSGLGTKWTSGSTVAAGDMVWFPNVPNQFFFVRDLQGSDRAMKVTTWATYNVSGPLYRGDCIYQSPEDFDSLFDMPKKDLYTIRGGLSLKEMNTTYTTIERYTAVADSGATFVSLSFSVADPDQLAITTPTAYTVVNNVTGETVSVYDVTLTTSSTAVIRLNAASTRAGDITKLQADTYTVYAPVLKRQTNAKEKIKSLATATTDISIQSTIEQDIIKVGKADVLRILKVEMFPNVNFGNDISGQLTGTGIDITSNYTLDDGQRDTHYDLGRLIKGKSVPYPVGPIRITFEYFEHSSGDYFSVDSYPDLLYEEIPNYNSKVTGRTVSLRDVLDFRPRVNDAGTFTGGNASLTALPQRAFGLQCDFAYYLPRKDKIILNKAGDFVLLKGVPSENPQQPQVPANTMELFDIEYKPFTYLSNSGNIVVKPIDNKRYTMRDIGKIEKRLSSLEKQVALNSLERQTATFAIKDQDGLDRFKNGFVVDNFKGHNVGDVTNPDYECSIDIIQNTLRPAFNTIGVDLVEVASTVEERNASNYRIHEGNVVTLPYYGGPQWFYKNKNEIAAINAKGANATSTEKFRKETLIRENSDLIVVEQPFATETVQATAMTQGPAAGIVQLFPSGDNWVETNVPAELVINEGGTYDNVSAQADVLGIDFGTIWNNWQVTSLGVPVSTISNTSWREGSGTWTATTTVVSQQVNQNATGKMNPLEESVGLTQINGRLTARQSVSYIRSRPIQFVASGLKPSTRVYAFLDETQVTPYCSQATRLYLQSRQYDYSEVPYQFGAANTERQVFMTFDTNAVVGGGNSNLERTFAGSISNDLVSYTTTFTSIYNGTNVAPTSVTISQALNDQARGLIVPNSEIAAFNKGEVIRGNSSGATAIVVLHEQSTNATTGQPDGVLDTLHVINVRGTFIAGENIYGTIKKDKLKGNTLNLRLRTSSHIEVPPPGVLVTTGTGRVAGVWLLTSGQTINNTASPKFLTGNRLFYLADSSTPSARTTYADSLYAASGIIDAQSTTTIGVRNAKIGGTDVTRNRSYIQQLSSNTTYSYVADPPPPPAPSNDPLAQTFVISNGSAENPEGSFVTEVELFFESKDATVPMLVELRTTNGGYPTTTVLPFAQKIVYPTDILTSKDGSLGTLVTFPAPVFVKTGVMYAVVLTTVSNQYKLWVGTMGQADKSPNKLGTVIQTPAIGSLFKSQNSGTWTESPGQDLKLCVYRAIFNYDQTLVGDSLLRLRAQDIPAISNAGRASHFTELSKNAFRTKVGQSEIIVRHPNHGMAVGSYVSYANVTGADKFGFTNTAFNSGTFIANQYDIKTSALTSTGTLVKHKVYNVYSHDLYSIRVYDTAGNAILATASGQFGGDQMTATRNAMFTTLHPAVEVLNFDSTGIIAEVMTTSGQSPHGSETPYLKDTSWTTVALNDNNFFKNQRVILNKQNEADLLDRNQSFELRLKLTSKSRFMSPIIDLDRAAAIVTQNRIDDPVTTKSLNSNYYSAIKGFDGSEIFVSEYDNKEGGAQVGYITRKVQFQNTSKLLKIQMAASIPSNCGIDKSTPTVTLPIKFKSGSTISEHPAILSKRTAVTTAYAIGTTAITLQDVTSLVDGMYVYGPGIQSQTRINGIAGSIITLDKATKAAIPSSSSGTVMFFTAFDITQQNKTSQIDVGDYVTYSGSGTPVPTGTYVIAAPKNSYFTKRVGSYATGSFVVASAANPVTLFNSTTGGIDPTNNNMTVYLDDVTNIKQGMYCYMKFYNTTDATYDWAPASVRRVLRINTDSKSIVLEKLSATDEFSTIGYSAAMYFNGNNSTVTFFNPTVRLSQAVTADIEPTMTTRTATNLLTFTTPPNAELEVYAKVSNGGNATSSNALQFTSSEYNSVSNPYAVDSTNEIIYFPVAHNLNTGSAVLYNAGSNAIGGLTTGSVYYAVFVTTTSIKLATTAANAAAVYAGTASPIGLTATGVAETHTLTDINQKNQASIEDSGYFRILPDTAIGGDQSTYGGANPLASGKGSLTTTDDPSNYIEHSFTADNLPAFNTAVIKIVMRSRNPAFVPKAKDLRIIATA